jgi:hypothetical protein
MSVSCFVGLQHRPDIPKKIAKVSIVVVKHVTKDEQLGFRLGDHLGAGWYWLEFDRHVSTE